MEKGSQGKSSNTSSVYKTINDNYTTFTTGKKDNQYLQPSFYAILAIQALKTLKTTQILKTTQHFISLLSSNLVQSGKNMTEKQQQIPINQFNCSVLL